MAAHGGDPLVKNFCSPRNILHAHNKLYLQLLEELCLLGSLKANPRAKKTIIIPDEKLTKHLVKLITDEGEDKVAQYCRMLILKGYAEGPGDIGDFPTLSGAYITVESSDKTKALVGGGGKVVRLDVGLRKLGAEPVFSVFELHDALVPIGAPVDAKDAPAPKKPKKGGADTSGLNSRKALFDRAIDETVAESQKTNGDKRDIALEILCSMAHYFEFEAKSPDISLAIYSMISDDTLTSLFLVLRPNSDSSPYVTDQDVGAWATSSHKPEIVHFCFHNPYKSIKEKAAGCAELAAIIKKNQEEVVNNVYKAGFVGLCNQAYQVLETQIRAHAGAIGKRAALDVKQLKYETEVRVAAAIHYDNIKEFGLDATAIKELYNKYFDVTIHLRDDVNMSAGQVPPALYLSFYLTALRSDGFFFLPCMKYEASIPDAVMSDDNKLLSLTKGLFDQHDSFYSRMEEYVAKLAASK